MFAAVPDIDENIPLPASAADALPELSPAEELQMRARTIALLADIQGKSLLPDVDGQHQAEDLARQMIENPHLRPEYALYPNETIAYLAGIVSQINHSIVDDLSDLKLYVVNKLVMEIENAKDSKSRITALKALGEVDGVDAFKRRSEMTVSYKPIEQVEKELLAVLEGVEYRVLGESGSADFRSAPLLEAKNVENLQKTALFLGESENSDTTDESSADPE